MLLRPMSRLLGAGLAWFAVSTGSGQARADLFYETAYVPTSSVLLPTSSILSTSYVVPTVATSTYIPTSSIYSVGDVYTTSTYRTVRYRPRRYVERAYVTSPSYSIQPTTYLSTSYLAPTSYLLPTSYLAPTSYVVPRSYVTTSYLAPTAYYSPTTHLAPTSYLIDGGLVRTSATSSDCDPVYQAPARSGGTGSANANPPKTEPTITSEPSNSNERRPTGAVDEGTNSNVTPPVPAPVNGGNKPRAEDPPVIVPGTTPAAGGTNPNDVQVPGPGQIAPRSDETSFRSSQRPANYDVRNILRGRVVSFDSGRPEEGVTVVIASRTKSFGDRSAMTDADGEFKVSLPEGDWTVKVRMPSGSLLAVGRDFLTASAGRVVDGTGRNVKEFLITR